MKIKKPPININVIIIVISAIIFLAASVIVTIIPTPGQLSGSTIAYFGDSEPASSSDIKELTRDLNQVIPLSPTGRVDAIFFMGDMTKLSLTLKAVAASDVKNVPVYFVIGNHEAGSSSETTLIQGRYSDSKFPLNPGPPGSDKTTYSMNVGNMHVINMNEYWNGETDDSYLKYSSTDGGYVPDPLYDWMSTDLSKTSDWKIVVGHDPLYPESKHVGNSLDANKDNRDKLQALFESENVDLFIGGHTHKAGVQNIGGVYHANTGVIGPGADGDGVASISYTYTNENSLILTIKQEDPTWSTPKTLATKTISR